jgi:hypothetical protein
MNKIVIVGHPQSGYEEVERLLNDCGMGVARPSRREGFVPTQISSTLCKVHSAQAVQELAEEHEVQQIEAGPVWHGMAMDLMLGNLEQPFWGWSDPQAIYLLNYWRDLDPDITFILLYDRPQTVLTRLDPTTASHLTPQATQQLTRNWRAYNAGLLHFFHRNPQRCLLVHTQQVRESASSYLRQIRARINAPWSEHMERLSRPEHDATPSHMEVSTGLDNPTARHTEATDQDPLTAYLADALVAQHPEALQLYEELQAVANLPHSDRLDARQEALVAWRTMADERLRLEQVRQGIAERQSLIDRLTTEHQKTRELAERREHERQQQAHRHALDQREAQDRTAALERERNAALDEGELLLSQLQQVQHELTELHALLQASSEQSEQERQAHAAERASLQQAVERQNAEWAASLSQAQLQHHQKLSALNQDLLQAREAWDTQRAALEAQLEHLQKTALDRLAERDRALAESDLLANQLQQMHITASERLAERDLALADQEKLAAQLAQLRDEQAKLIERTQLTTRKAAAEMQRLANGHQTLEQDNQQLAERLRQLERERDQLQQKAAQVEATRAEDDLLLQQLLHLQRDLELSHAENQRLRQTAFKPTAPAPAPKPKALKTTTKPAYYGAGQRVQQQLSYKLGSAMILHTQNHRSLFTLPAVLLKISRQHKLEQPQRDALKLPPINRYRDASEADRYRQHLSYRLGTTLLKNLRNPLGWIRMPFALRRELRDHRQRRQSTAG